ncbi:MAG: DMT family transporter [Armatimonadota bacterium]
MRASEMTGTCDAAEAGEAQLAAAAAAAPASDRRGAVQLALGYVAALLTGAIMGISWPLQKFILAQEVIGPATLHWLNVIGLFALATPAYLLRYGGRVSWQGFRLWWMLPFGGVACVMHYCRNFGVAATSSTTAAVVEESEIVFVFLLSYLVLRRPVRALGWLGTALVLYGTVRVALVGAQTLHFDPLGVVALVVVGLTIAVNATMVKALFSGIPNELIILGSVTVQIVVFSLAAPATGALPGVARLVAMPGLLALVALGSLVWGSRLLLYYYALKRAPVWAVRMLALTGLPVATLADLLVLHMPVTWAHVQGLLAAGGGAMLVIVSSRAEGGGEIARRSQEAADA